MTYERPVFSMKVRVLFIFMIACLSILSGIDIDSGNIVQQAYRLRIKGQAEAAKQILAEAIAEDSTLAVSWFELARTQHHISLGNPRELVKNLVEINRLAEKAVELDSKNVIYRYYLANLNFLNFYVAMQMGGENLSENFNKVAESYKTVLKLKPDYHEAKLFLVELYAMVPEGMGGNRKTAEKYVQELEQTDFISGAKAREIIMPDEADYIEYWQKNDEKMSDNPEIKEALGKAYFYKDSPEEAAKIFDEAMSLSSDKNILHVELGRYYLMQAMQDRTQIDLLFPLIEKAFNTYLESTPEPINPLKAYVLGQLAGLKMRSGNEEQGKELIEKAKALDPNYSKAFGIPSQILFCPPDKLCRVHTYFFRPF